MADPTWTGGLPDCPECLDRLADPVMTPAIHSVAISRRQSPAVVARQYIADYHRRGHGG